MQTTTRTLPKRLISTKLTKPSTRTIRFRTPVQTTRNMSFFPRYLGYDYPSYDSGLTPLFRLLDDFDSYRSSGAAPTNAASKLAKTFNPKFDVKETEASYELHGELPGIEQKDVELEFTDAQTLSIRGRSERSYQSGTPPDHLLGAGKEQGRITSAEESEHHTQPRKASVADEDEEKAREAGQAVEKSDKSQKKAEQPKEKFWVSERSVGEFARSFHFPSRIDQDAVKASMKNGILSIVVPKAQERKGGKRIEIS